MVLRSYAAFARDDIETAVATVHPEVEWIEPDEFPHGGRRQGPEAVADYLRSSRALWAELVSEPTAHRRGEDIVGVHHVFGRLLNGSPRDVTVADVFTIRNGLVVRMQAYADPAEALSRGRRQIRDVRADRVAGRPAFDIPSTGDALTARGAERVVALITERAPEAVRLRSVLGLRLTRRHPLERLVNRSGRRVSCCLVCCEAWGLMCGGMGTFPPR
jgi:ketosteroid isomerase-like protein